MGEQYSNLASVYDALNVGCDYDKLAMLIDATIKKYEKTKTSLVLDLACGTGKLTFLLRDLGYDMTGVDSSEAMLSLARDYAENHDISDVLFLCQDMRSFELYGTVDACVSTLDSINYLTKLKDVESCFKLVHNYLIPDGVFIFDLNTPYRFNEVYGTRDYVLENESALLAWQNDYNKKTKLCKFYLSIFEENKNGTYSRFDEVQTEKCYERKQIEALLKKCGFELLCVYGDTNMKAPEDTDEKWYFVSRCKK
ncbi:MAG: class I SAM-dependent methyltransferase [Clostridia bacterium]|nr:class I SAM-dependent methyltransferase [Clostridia bacterium]